MLRGKREDGRHNRGVCQALILAIKARKSPEIIYEGPENSGQRWADTGTSGEVFPQVALHKPGIIGWPRAITENGRKSLRTGSIPGTSTISTDLRPR
jgi:hypothetical protein